MRRRRSPIIAVIAIAACALFLWSSIPDLRFALEGEAVPVDPAAGGLADARHVRLEGRAEPLGFQVQLRGDVRDPWLFEGTKVIVLQPASAAGREPGELSVTGRLYAGDRRSPWQPAAAAVAAKEGGEPGDYWVLVAGERPELPWGTLALVALLLAILVVNVVWLRGWWRERKSVATPPPAD